MTERRVRVTELATTTGLTPEMIADVQHCRKAITPEAAQRLAVGTHMAAATWLRMQAMYDDHQRRTTLGNTAPDEGL